MLLFGIFLFGFTLWLGVYLLGRDPQQLRLRYTGLGLVFYAVGLAIELLIAFASTSTMALLLARIRWPLLFLPALLWIGALLDMVDEDRFPVRPMRRFWRASLLPLLVGIALLGLGANDLGNGGALLYPSVALHLLLTLLVVIPLVVLVWLVWRSRPFRWARNVIGILIVTTLFFTLGTGLLLIPLGLPHPLALVLVGIDLLVLGGAIAWLDALEQGETLLPDMRRSFFDALLAAVLFGGQVGIASLLGLRGSFTILVLLLTILATAIIWQTLGEQVEGLLDRLALARSFRTRQEREALRTAASALPRRRRAETSTELLEDEEEFTRLARRALSHYGNLSRLVASPLTTLPLIERRLAARGATDNPLERANELKRLLGESIERLKPLDGNFGISDEWRHYNSLYFPYVVGLKPYSRHALHDAMDPVAREALAWFRSQVPQRTLHNWQNQAAELVAKDLLARHERPDGFPKSVESVTR
ncbi:MAG: hypothetical protein ACRDIB_00700 [Ardenticatenaceae bacterium]